MITGLLSCHNDNRITVLIMVWITVVIMITEVNSCHNDRGYDNRIPAYDRGNDNSCHNMVMITGFPQLS